jgi:hypothetical protein
MVKLTFHYSGDKKITIVKVKEHGPTEYGYRMVTKEDGVLYFREDFVGMEEEEHEG